MAIRQFVILVSTLLLLPLAFPSIAADEYVVEKPVEKKVAVVVEGVVYCQSCDRFGTWSLTGAELIPSAKVSVLCKNHWGQVSYYKAFEADSKGYFYAQLEGFEMNHDLLDHPLQSCKVKLVSSPNENCSLLSNVNYGMYGAPLRFEDKVLRGGKSYEAVIYAAGPLAFRPNHCPPTTHY
ncbi:Pollen Ole e 1 allergen and extensin family protein [Trema orientale]|uniref:Pollen Ole e 1 allergen and extensin family protein n=2 Tax=Cannabaceae TaxID=3481 RepID=A0A2P5BRG4_PARAD|nr:Pollen Ole e 1 allergen and extensin family protein [Trema orientale]PON51388.1 Pollen Ole e 1 allergen and extensin family protein [Parasponia andersonii]